MLRLTEITSNTSRKTLQQLLLFLLSTTYLILTWNLQKGEEEEGEEGEEGDGDCTLTLFEMKNKHFDRIYQQTHLSSDTHAS